MIAVALFLAVLQSAPAGIEILKAEPGRACSLDGERCVGVVGEGDEVQPMLRVAADLPAAAPEETYSSETYASWPGLIRTPGGILAGIEVQERSMYSGGGGSASTLRLYRLNADGDAAGDPVLTVPLKGALKIRACFSEEDMKQRAGACHDEYEFAAVLTADSSGGGWPVLTYATTATAFPRGASRSEDSLEKPPLTEADLVAAPDPKCSFERRFVFDSFSGVYRPDASLPDCSDYTVP